VLRSMTGFGTAVLEDASLVASASLRSVNHRYLDVTLHLGPGLAGLERDVRALVESRLVRGRVDATLRATVRDGSVTAVGVDHPLVAGVCLALRDAQKLHKLQGQITVADMARFPGVLQVSEATITDQARRAILTLAGAALEELDQMRRQEGSNLADHLLRCLIAIEEASARITALWVAGRESRQEAVRERARDLQGELGLDETRLCAEVVRLVDRSDISEEVERLRSHLVLARCLIGGDQPAGKRLDFLAQELMREANTIGSKSASAPLTHEVVSLKSEIERFREQVQNVE
jgi:uncharacterized protein (TIGR00255 family)